MSAKSSYGNEMEQIIGCWASQDKRFLVSTEDSAKTDENYSDIVILTANAKYWKR